MLISVFAVGLQIAWKNREIHKVWRCGDLTNRIDSNKRQNQIESVQAIIIKIIMNRKHETLVKYQHNENNYKHKQTKAYCISSSFALYNMMTGDDTTDDDTWLPRIKIRHRDQYYFIIVVLNGVCFSFEYPQGIRAAVSFYFIVYGCVIVSNALAMYKYSCVHS